MAERTIYYLSPDVNTPSGGVRVLYRHVDILNRSGRPAQILHHDPGFKITWFRHETPTGCLAAARITRDDVVVVPEVYGPDILEKLRGVPKVIFNQSGFLTFSGAEPGSLPSANIHVAQEVIGALAVSAYVMEYVQHVFPGVRAVRVVPSVDTDVFRFGRKKLPVVAFMPRRNTADIHIVLNMLKWRGALNGWEIASIHGASPQEVARIMGQSAVFFAFSPQEGFGLPAVEAMACGCLVVGYHGFGGREFMKPEFSFPVEPCDVLGFARAAEEAIEVWQYDEYRTRRMCRYAQEYVSEHYSPEKERASVLEAWDALLGQS